MDWAHKITANIDQRYICRRLECGHDRGYVPTGLSPCPTSASDSQRATSRASSAPRHHARRLQERPKVPKVNKVKLPEPGFTESEAEDMRANAKIRTLSDDDPMSESSASSEFRARIRRVCSFKSIKDVDKFLKKEELRCNDDEEVDIEEFEGLEAEIDDEAEAFEDYQFDEATNEEVPTWSHEFEEGPPKLEIERLMDMRVLKPISEEQATNANYKRLYED